MRARLRAESEDQRDQRAPGSDCVRQQSETDISAAELFGHDPRTDYGNKQKRGRYQFGNGLVDNRTAQRASMGGNLQESHGAGSPFATMRRWPSSSTFRRSARRSKVSSLKLVKSLMRVSSAWYA